MIGACDAPPTPEPAPKPAAAPPAAPPAVAPPAVAPPVEAPKAETPPAVAPPVEAPLAGSGPSGAEGRAARRQAVLDLLTDGRSAAALDVIAASPGRAFDPELADAMTPKVYKNIVPGVRQLQLRVEGPLDKEIVRRIVRAHINELRYCYNQGLARDPNLSGKLEIEFTILADGKVGTSVVRSSTLRNPEVGTCSAKAVTRWTFPKPEKVVRVIHPFEMTAP